MRYRCCSTRCAKFFVLKGIHGSRGRYGYLCVWSFRISLWDLCLGSGLNILTAESVKAVPSVPGAFLVRGAFTEEDIRVLPVL